MLDMETPDGLFRFEIIEREMYDDDPVGQEIVDETVLGVFHLSDNGISWVLDSCLTAAVLADRLRGRTACRVCGCTDSFACGDIDEGPCWWVEPDLCSRCAATKETAQ